MRIAIVNDLLLAVEVLRRIVKAVPGYEVVWVAHNGADAVRKCAQQTPDLILMDLVMPIMDGVEATCNIMKQSPCAILIVTATVSGNAAKVFEAMGCGALDAVKTPIFGPDGKIQGSRELLAKINTISKLIGKTPSPEKRVDRRRIGGNIPYIVAIGSSTGGPKALAEILSVLPKDFNAAVVIVQHVDVQFAEGLAEWLNELCVLPVMLAGGGQRLERGIVYVAATNDHLVMGSDLVLHYTPEPRDYPYRPSVDEFFFSLEKNWPGKGIAILLTGMGKDGAKGLAALRKAGWHTIAQDEATSVVYGMPKAAAEIGAAKEILPLGQIGDFLVRRVPSQRQLVAGIS